MLKTVSPKTSSPKKRVILWLALSSMAAGVFAADPDVKVELDDQLTTDADGDGNVDRDDTITYQGEVDNSAGTDEAQNVVYEATLDANTTLVAGSVKVTPVAVNDDYDTLGNVTYSVGVVDGLLSNDFDPKDANAPTNAGMSVTAETIATAQGGSATINSDGSFSYEPALNFTGIDSFNYTTVDDDAMTNVGTVTVNVTGKVWFVDANAAAGGDGSQSMPFNDFSMINGAGGVGDSDEAGDVIYLFEGNYSDALELEADQRLVGAGSELSAGSATIIPAGTAPSYSGSLTLAADNTVEGFVFAPSSGYSITASAVSGGVIQNASFTLSGSGGAIDLDNHTGNFVYSGNITGSTSTNAIAVNGGSANITIDGDVTVNGGRNIDVQNITGGGLSVTGAVANSGGAGINLVNNSGSPSFEFQDVVVTSGVGTAVNLQDSSSATYSFAGNFDITTTNGAGLVANSGLLNLSDANSFNNTINTTNGSALDLNSGATGINVGTLTFDSLTSSNANQRGVDLYNVQGSVEILGDITVNDTSVDGVRFERGSADISVLGNINVDGFAQSAVIIDGDNTLGQVIVGDIQAINSGVTSSEGIIVANASNPVTAGTITLGDNSNSDGLVLTNNAADITFSGIDIGSLGTVNGQAVSITGNNSGTIDLGSGSIANAAGSALSISGGTADVEYGGSISHATGGSLLSVVNHSVGTVTLSVGALEDTGGEGLFFDNAAGTYSLDGTVNINGAQRGLLVQNSSGSISLNNATIVKGDSSFKALSITGGTATVNYLSGSVTQNDDVVGIEVADNTGGSISIGANVVMNTSTANAVEITNNSATAIDFSGELDVDTTSGKALVASGGGTLSLTSGANLFDTATGPLLELNGVTIGAGGINISSAATSGIVAADAVNLTDVTGGNFALDALTVAGTSGGGDGVEVNASPATTSFGTVTLDDVSGRSLYLNGANGDVTIGSVDLDGGVGNGIEIVDNTNAVTINGGSVGSTTGITANAFDVSAGSGDITMAAAISNSQNRAIEITGRTAGTVEVSGSISETGNGLNISDNTGGTVVLSDTSKTINTGASTALRLLNNGSSMINITNGGLDIDTSTGAGINATGGVIAITGAGNTITATSGKALSLVNANIASSNVTFQGISQSGGANAITLNNTGTAGGLKVTGVSSTVGSGGTLSGMTAEAILLTDTKDALFNGLQISNITHEAIKGLRVNGITVTNTTVDDAGSTEPEADDDTFGFVGETLGENGLFGTARFENITITNTHERAIDIVNEAGGTLDLDIINVSIDDNDDTQGEDAIRVQSEGTINTDVLLSGGTFNDLELDAFAYFASSTGTHNVTVTGITSTNGGGPDNFPNGGGIAIIAEDSASVTFDINNNNLTGVQGEGVQIVGLGGPGQTLTMTGSITGNTFASDNADGIDLDFDGDPAGTSTINLTIDVNSNDISFDDDGLGIDYRDAAGTGNFTVRNNSFTVINGDDGTNDSDDGIFIFTDSDVASGASHLNVAISNNTFSGIQAGNKNIVVEDVRDAGTSACFNMTGNSTGTIELDFENTGDGGEVTQASIAEIESDNNSSTVNVVSEQPAFNATSCASVPLP